MGSFEKVNRLCPECKKRELVVMANMIFSVPSKYEHKLTKKVMASGDFKLWGVDWRNDDWICPTCGIVKSGDRESNLDEELEVYKTALRLLSEDYGYGIMVKADQTEEHYLELAREKLQKVREKNG